MFQGGSPWAILILNSVYVVVALYCVQLFFGRIFFPKSFSPFLFLSFANYVSIFYFLSSILLEVSKRLISQNIGCLIKTPFKKYSTQTMFQRSSPWATLILNNVFAVVALYCVQLFVGRIFSSKIILSCPFPFLC